jgi:hypothetical protein
VGKEDLHVMRISNRECCNVDDVKATLYKKEFLYVLSKFIVHYDCNLAEIPAKIYCGIMSFVKIDATEYTLHLQAYVKFYPHFPHLVSDVGKIRSAHNATHICNFRESKRRKSTILLNKITSTHVP